MTQIPGTTTLAAIRECRPCGIEKNATTGFRLLLHSLGGAPSMSTRISLGDIALSNGANDAWWCVRALDWSDTKTRRAVVSVLLFCVERAAKYTTDQRVHDCITAIHTWCEGDDSVDLAAAVTAANAAAWAAAGSKRSSAGSSRGSSGAAADAAAAGQQQTQQRGQQQRQQRGQQRGQQQTAADAADAAAWAAADAAAAAGSRTAAARAAVDGSRSIRT